MAFLPKQDLLTLEELDRLCGAFIERGVRKLRLTGGEPLVRRGIMTLVRALSRHLGEGLDELTLTTNGSQLPKYAAELADCGVKRINVSLDTLDADKFRAITRWGELDKVLAGIDAAQRAGLAVKINAVALKGVNEDELADLTAWSHGRGMDLTIRGDAARRYREAARPVPAAFDGARAPRRALHHGRNRHRTGGPARYVRVAETGDARSITATHNSRESDACAADLRGISTCASVRRRADLRAAARLDEQRPVNAAIDEAICASPRATTCHRSARAPARWRAT